MEKNIGRFASGIGEILSLKIIGFGEIGTFNSWNFPQKSIHMISHRNGDTTFSIKTETARRHRIHQPTNLKPNERKKVKLLRLIRCFSEKEIEENDRESEREWRKTSLNVFRSHAKIEFRRFFTSCFGNSQIGK
jgi:hypothetical protein